MLVGFSGLSSWSFCLDCFACFFSVNKNCFIFSLFLLYSRTVLHATKCNSLGFVSFMSAKSFFLTSVFFLVFVSSVIVVGE